MARGNEAMGTELGDRRGAARRTPRGTELKEGPRSQKTGLRAENSPGTANSPGDREQDSGGQSSARGVNSPGDRARLLIRTPRGTELPGGQSSASEVCENSPGDRARLLISASRSALPPRIPGMRKPRELQDGALYHVTARANRKEMILDTRGMKELFLQVVVRARKRYDFGTPRGTKLAYGLTLANEPSPCVSPVCVSQENFRTVPSTTSPPGRIGRR